MPSQEEFLASMQASNAVVFLDNYLSHGARSLRERLSQDLYDETQLRHAEEHEAAIVQQQRERLHRSLPSILELPELSETDESDSSEAEDKDYQGSEFDELIFSKEEVERCVAVAHARSGRDSAIDIGDGEEPCYITALAATLEAVPVETAWPWDQYYVHYPPGQRVTVETDALDSKLEAITSVVDDIPEVEEPSSASNKPPEGGRIEGTLHLGTGLAEFINRPRGA